MSVVTYYVLLTLVSIFRKELANYYFHEHYDVYKYFFIILNFFFLRAFFQAIKLNGSLILRAFGMGV